MKAITFLGAATAHTLEYEMPDGRRWQAPYFGAAIPRFLPDVHLRAFVTKAAREMHWSKFLELTEDIALSVEAIDIPDGSSTEEMWTIFQRVVDVVDNEEQVIFDITHGFRSLPFLSFLAAAYLREVKDVTLHAVYYGNFELRDRRVEPNRAPVVDLTEFVELLDWMIATDRFSKTGNSGDLAALLERAKPNLVGAPKAETNSWQHSPIRKAVGAMQSLSLALRLIRPDEAMNKSSELVALVDAARSDSWQRARPFQPLAPLLAEAYRPIGLPGPNANPLEALQVERELVDWYMLRGQYVQAMALAREWLVTWVMLWAGNDQVLDGRQRRLHERALTALAPNRRESDGTEETADLSAVPDCGEVAQLFQKIGDVRNDLLHAGKRKQPLAAQKLEEKIRDSCAALQKLDLPGATHP